MKTKKYLKFLTMTLMLVLILALVPHVQSEAASAKKKALKAYKEFLAVGRSADGRTIEEFCTALITNDNVPELICEDLYTTYIYTYKGGNMKLLFEDSSYYVYSYYKKKNALRTQYAHRGYQTTRYLKYSKGEYQEKLLMEKWTSGGTRYNKCVKYDTKKISKSSFNKQLKSYVGSAKATKFKLYKNTASQRNKRLK